MGQRCSGSSLVASFFFYDSLRLDSVCNLVHNIDPDLSGLESRSRLGTDIQQCEEFMLVSGPSRTFKLIPFTVFISKSNEGSEEELVLRLFVYGVLIDTPRRGLI